MFEFYDGHTLCIQGRALYEHDIMSRANYNKLRQRYFEVIRSGGNGRTALISYNSIPERFKTKIEKIFGDPYKTTKNQQFKNYLKQDLKANDFFDNYTLDSGDPLPEKSKQIYKANAIVLNAIHDIVNSVTAKRKTLGGRKTKIWQRIAEVIHELPRHTYPHNLPSNTLSLKRKYKAYMEDGYQALIHKNFCNKNSEKINEDAKFWILSRWADQVNKCATISQLYSEYNEKAVIEGWKPLKDSDAIKNYLDQEQSVWYAHRYGELKSKEKFTYQHTTKMPSVRDSLWYSDGTKLNYYFINENGNIDTCQVYEVMDAYSEVLLGYHISKTEDYEAQYYAYKMAAQTSGFRPYEIRFDNQGGHKKLETGNFLDRIARLSIKTQPYNGKSKTIESAFGRFQQQYLKRDWFFTGQNITAKKEESKANREFILANKQNLPTLKEIKEVYKKRRQQWNEGIHSKTGKPRIEMYLSSENSKTTKLNLWDMVDLFWIKRPKAITCTPGGLSFKDKKVEYKYMVYKDNQMPDFEWLRKWIDKKLIVKYDPEDMSMIYLYEQTPLGLRFVSAATTKIEIHRNKQEQEEWEASWYSKVNEANKKLRVESYEKMEQILEDHGASAEQQGLNRPKISGVKSTYQKKSKPTSIGEDQKLESNTVEIVDSQSSVYDRY